MIQGRLFSEWFGSRPKSQSCRPKVGVTDEKSELQPGRAPESEPNRPKYNTRRGGFKVLLQKTTLKAFLNPWVERKLLHKRQVRPPQEFCGTFGVLQEVSAEGFAWWKPAELSHRTPEVLQNFGSQAQFFRHSKFFSHSTYNSDIKMFNISRTAFWPLLSSLALLHLHWPCTEHCQHEFYQECESELSPLAS